MAILPIKTFLGLRTGVSDPEMGTAGTATNFRRNRVRGQLEIIDGYQTNLAFAPTPIGVSALVPIAYRSFYVADQGGRVITAMLATYTKTALGYSTPATVNTTGIFLRPYYNGTTWVDDWQETTEFVIVKYFAASASTITIYNSPATGLATNYMAGWTAMAKGDFAQLTNTGFRITANTDSTIFIDGLDADLADNTAGTAWATGDLIYCFRNIHNKMIPASITANFRNVLDELRLNTGNTTSDLDVAVFYRDKSFFQGRAQAIKGTFSEYGQLTVPAEAFKLRNLTVTGVPDGGLPAGSYTFKGSLLMDDGQETELRDVLVGNFPDTVAKTSDLPLGTDAGVIASDGTHIYAASYISSSTYSYIWRITSANEIDQSVVLTTATQGSPFAIACVGGFVYVLMVGNGNTEAWLNKYDSSLNFIASGVAYTLPYMVVGPNQLAGAANATSFFALNSAVNPLHHKLIRWNLATLTQDAVSADIGSTFHPGEQIAVDANFVVTPGLEKLLQWDTATLTPTDFYTSVGSVATAGVTIGAGNAYVGAGATLKKWVLATGVFTDLLTGGDAAGWQSLDNDGTYIYGMNNATLKKITMAGVLVTSLVDSSADLAESIVHLGLSIFGLTNAFVCRLFSISLTGTTFASNGFLIPGYDVAVSPGLVPRRARFLNVYVSKDAGPYYEVHQHNLLSGGDVFAASSIYDTVLQHRYVVSTGKTITAADLLAATDSSLNNLGRTDPDAGTNRYLYAITANNRTYAAGVSIAGRVQRNKVFIDAVSGIGVSMYDVLPNDSSTVLDVEFNDGDYIVALGNVADKVLVLKSHSLVMLTPLSDGSHQRDLVSDGVGIAATNSLVKYDEALYWLDHSGVWKFTANGLEKMSGPIDDELFALTNAQRKAALGTVDPKNSQYRLLINGVIYVCDLKDHEWVTETGGSQLWFGNDLGFGDQQDGSLANASSARRYMQLVGTNIQTPVEDTFAGTCTWESSRIELPLERGYDGMISALYMDYDMKGTSPTVTVSLFLDEEDTARKIYVLPAGSYEVTLAAPLAATCKTFRLRITAVVSSGDKIKIRRLGAYFTQMLAGGDQRTIPSKKGSLWAYGLPAPSGSYGANALATGQTTIAAAIPTTSGGAPAALTIEGWFRLNSVITVGSPINRQAHSMFTMPNWFIIWILGEGFGFDRHIFITAQPNTTWNSDFIDTGVVVNVGEKHHYAFVFDALTNTQFYVTIYVDGVVMLARTQKLKGSLGSAADTVMSLGGFFNNLTFGNPNVSTAPCDYDEVRVWNTARSQAEILANKNIQISAPRTGLLGCWSMDAWAYNGGSVTNDIADISGNANVMRNFYPIGSGDHGNLGTVQGLF